MLDTNSDIKSSVKTLQSIITKAAYAATPQMTSRQHLRYGTTNRQIENLVLKNDVSDESGKPIDHQPQSTG